MAKNATSAADHFGILDAAVAIGSESDFDAVGQRALAEFCRLIPSTVVTLNEVDATAGRFRFWTEPVGFTFAPAVAAAWEELASQNPLISRYQRTGDGSAHRFSDVWSVDDYHASELYRRVYEPMGIEHQLAFTIPEPLPVVIGFVMSRCVPDYSERDRQVADLLRPHIAQAWRNARELELLRSARPFTGPHATDADKDFDRGMVTLDGGEIIDERPGSLALPHEQFGSAREMRSGLPDAVRDWLAEERKRLSVTRPTLATALSVRRASTVTTVRRVPPTADRPETLLIRRQRPDAASPTLESWGLTPREAEVFRLLTTGATNVSIARGLGISSDTVKRHLSRVYRKTGVSGRVQAALFALENIGPSQP